LSLRFGDEDNLELMYPAGMDVERTMEFILRSQARAETRMEKLESRIQNSEIRANARMDRIDRRLEGTSKLIQHGMRMLVKIETKLDEVSQAQKRTDVALAELAKSQTELAKSHTELAQAHTELAKSHAELAQAQKATEKSLKAFIDSLRHGRNGRK
jgi:chromosome segregation ATPase